MDDMAVRWAELMLGGGVSGNEAARQVGFANGRPSVRARRLLEVARMLAAYPEAVSAALEERSRLERQLARAQARVAELGLWIEASSLVAKTGGEVSGCGGAACQAGVGDEQSAPGA